MPIIQPKIIVPDTLFDDYLSGKVEIKGLAKSTDSGRIVKHLDTTDSDENPEAMAVAAVIGVIVIVTTVVAGITVKLISKAKQKKVEEFKKSLNAYITAANEQTLNTKIIDRLISATDNLKRSTRKKVMIEFSTKELSALIDCLCNHTNTIAQANNIRHISEYTSKEKNDVFLRLRKNLILQKEMLKQTA